MIRVIDILNVLEEAAPSRLAASYDNVGFIVGHRDKEVKKIVVALDITGDVIEEAVATGAELIVSHHPIIFGARSTVTDCDTTGSLVLKLIENGISAICMHTNLDSAAGGVNDILAVSLGVHDTKPVEPQEDGTVGCGRYGKLKTCEELSGFLKKVCTELNTCGVKYHDAGKPVLRVAVGGGSCGDYIKTARLLGCDTVVTADIKHNQFLEAKELGINAIDAGHFATEDVVCPRLCEIISEKYPEVSVRIADADIDCTQFFTV